MKIVKQTPQTLDFHEYIFIVRRRLNGSQVKVARGAAMIYNHFLEIELGRHKPTEKERMEICASLTGLATKEQIQLAIPGGVVGIAKAIFQEQYFLSLTAPEIFNLYLKANKLTKAKFAKKLGLSKQNLDNWSIGLVIPDPENREKIEKATKGQVKSEFWGYV